MKDRRRGSFQLAMSNLEKKPEIVRQIMGRCMIVRAETLMMCGCIEYHAYSPDFRECEVGEQIPEYQWIVNEVEGTVTAQEVER